MSRTKYVEYRDCGFWAYDVALSIFLKYLIDAAIPRASKGNEWLSDAVSWWRVIAVVPDYGLKVDPAWSPAQINIFTELAGQACNLLGNRESIMADEITAWSILEDLHIHPRGATEVSTAPIVELGRAIIALVQGSVPEAPAGRSWLYGVPEGRMSI